MSSKALTFLYLGGHCVRGVARILNTGERMEGEGISVDWWYDGWGWLDKRYVVCVMGVYSARDIKFAESQCRGSRYQKIRCGTTRPQSLEQ